MPTRVAVAAVVAWLWAGPSLQAQTDSNRVADPAWLRERLERVREKARLPAVAAAVVVDGKVVAASAVGVRKWGDPEKVRRNDAFHLGSVAKPLSATMYARLIDRKVFGWDSTMAELFPELAGAMNPAYRSVTVSQQLSHSSGMPYQPHTHESVTDARGKNPTGRRYEYVKEALADEPEAPPGTKVIYSGGGILVASAAERRTKTPYETLMRDLVFGPLGMATAGFGCTAHPGRVDGPWEHQLRDGRPVAIAPDPAQSQQPRSPVGRNVHCSVTDLAKFAAAHLPKGHRPEGFLSADALRALHTAVPPVSFAPGWDTARVYWAEGTVLWHSGSNGKNYALVHVVPGENYATCILTNVDGEGVGHACDLIHRELVTQIRRGRVLTGPATAEGDRPPAPDLRLDDLTPDRASTGFGKVRAGKNGAGGPLGLGGDVYERGLGVHAPSEVVYTLRPGDRRFVARAGIDDQQYGHGSVTVEVYIGDRRALASPLIRGGDTPFNVDVAIAPGDAGKPFRLVVTDGGDGHDWDLTDWVDAGFVAAPR